MNTITHTIHRTTNGYSAGRWEAITGPFSPREAQCMALKACGLTNAATAAAMGIKTKSLDGRLANIYYKLGVNHIAAAIAMAMHRGLINHIILLIAIIMGTGVIDTDDQQLRYRSRSQSTRTTRSSGSEIDLNRLAGGEL